MLGVPCPLATQRSSKQASERLSEEQRLLRKLPALPDVQCT